MHAIHLTYAWPLFGAGAVSLALALLAWRRGGPGAAPFALMMLASAVWSGADGLLHLSDLERFHLLWTRVEYVGIVSIAPLWLLTAVTFTRREAWLTPARVAVLWVVPVFTLGLVWTLDRHDLFYRSWDFRRGGTVLRMELEYGAGWWLHTVYSYLLVLTGAGLFLDAATRSIRAHRSQAVAILVGVTAPVAANLAYLAGIGPFASVDPTPLAFALTGVALGWAIVRLRLFDLAPLARETVIEGLADGVLILDPSGRVADLNPEAERILGAPGARMVGRPLSRLLDDAGRGTVEGRAGERERVGAPREILLTVEGEERVFEVRVSAVTSPRGELQGRVVVLHDATEWREMGRELRSAREEILRLRGLLPLCSWCRNVRNDDGYWENLESYVGQQGQARFTHGICPSCRSELEAEAGLGVE